MRPRGSDASRRPVPEQASRRPFLLRDGGYWSGGDQRPLLARHPACLTAQRCPPAPVAVDEERYGCYVDPAELAKLTDGELIEMIERLDAGGHDRGELDAFLEELFRRIRADAAPGERSSVEAAVGGNARVSGLALQGDARTTSSGAASACAWRAADDGPNERRRSAGQPADLTPRLSRTDVADAVRLAALLRECCDSEGTLQPATPSPTGCRARRAAGP